MTWLLNGNSNTDPSQHFLGTTDQKPVAVKTSGVERVTVTDTGKVGIGTNAPLAKLTVETGTPDIEPHGTAAFHRQAVGPHWSHIHYGPRGDWYIRSAQDDGVVVLQDIPDGRVGINKREPEATLDVNGGVLVRDFRVTDTAHFSGNVRVTDTAHFTGNVQVTGDIVLQNADCAEEFTISHMEGIDPGTVMVVDEEGALRPSTQAYDKKVVGVISGAGPFKPALILDKQPDRSDRMPIALMGKIFCKVDADWGAIETGDLLTTSPTSGHAMKATDPLRAFGTVIGKALSRLKQGRGTIPILVALQ